MTQSTLYLTVGLAGTGKTTAARRIEEERGALRLTKDEWMKALYGRENPAPASDVIEGRLIQIGMRVLRLGIDVVLDFGLWSRDERSALRQAAAELGAAVVICYFELTVAEQRQRLDKREAEAPHQTWPMSDAGTHRMGREDRHSHAGRARRKRPDRRAARRLRDLARVDRLPLAAGPVVSFAFHLDPRRYRLAPEATAVAP